MDKIPPDHIDGLIRARLALEGLSVGDAFGAHANIAFATEPPSARVLPPDPWRYTDDTEMACAIYEVLRDHGDIDSAALATQFVARYRQNRGRGYSDSTQDVLLSIARGMDWSEASLLPFDGQGSAGNGGAMRAAPIGAYFAQPGSNDYSKVVAAATASSEVTHRALDGICGTIAVALAAAWAARLEQHRVEDSMFDVVLKWTPQSQVRTQIEKARDLDPRCPVPDAAAALGTGAAAIESVPFSLWCASRNFHCFTEYLWTALAGGGDRDTNCAIVGAISALRLGETAVPPEWLRCREPLSIDDL